MATNNVLTAAIRKLKDANFALLEKRGRCKTEKEAEAINAVIARNESMILDYEYRLRNELG